MKKPPIRRLARYQQWAVYTGTSIIRRLFDTRREARAFIYDYKKRWPAQKNRVMLPVKVRMTVEEI